MNRFSRAKESCWAFTTSPMEIMPAKRPSASIGRWRNPPGGHQSHDLLDFVLGRAGHQRRGHCLDYAHFGQGFLLGNAGVEYIAFADDARQTDVPRGIRATDDQGADAAFDERVDHVLQGSLGRNRVDSAPFEVENLLEFHVFPFRRSGTWENCFAKRAADTEL